MKRQDVWDGSAYQLWESQAKPFSRCFSLLLYGIRARNYHSAPERRTIGFSSKFRLVKFHVSHISGATVHIYDSTSLNTLPLFIFTIISTRIYHRRSRIRRLALNFQRRQWTSVAVFKYVCTILHKVKCTMMARTILRDGFLFLFYYLGYFLMRQIYRSFCCQILNKMNKKNSLYIILYKNKMYKVHWKIFLYLNF